VGLGCTGRYMDVMERFRVGLGYTGRCIDVMEGFRVGLGCMGRYMDVMECSGWAWGVQTGTWTSQRGSGGPGVHGQVH
jgi:hypothetical protein